MRRADRLFQIIQILRRGRVVTARSLAEALEVSERTIYRDIRDLSTSGVPLAGEPGVGYLLRGYDLPPLMFSREELEALVLGARIVEAWTDPQLARAARRALDKVESVLPEGMSHLIDETPLFAPNDHFPKPVVKIDLAGLRDAIRTSRKVHLSYRDVEKRQTERIVQPLAMAFYGPVWLLLAWCELRRDFRAFRPDRIESLKILEEVFESVPGRSLHDYLGRPREDEPATRGREITGARRTRRTGETAASTPAVSTHRPG